MFILRYLSRTVEDFTMLLKISEEVSKIVLLLTNKTLNPFDITTRKILAAQQA